MNSKEGVKQHIRGKLLPAGRISREACPEELENRTDFTEGDVGRCLSGGRGKAEQRCRGGKAASLNHRMGLALVPQFFSPTDREALPAA